MIIPQFILLVSCLTVEISGSQCLLAIRWIDLLAQEAFIMETAFNSSPKKGSALHPKTIRGGACTPIYYEWPLLFRYVAQLGRFVCLKVFRSKDMNRRWFSMLCRTRTIRKMSNYPDSHARVAVHNKGI